MTFESPKQLDKSTASEEINTEKLLEEQFQKVEPFDVNGHELKVLDIRPREAKSEIPVVIAGGYGTSSPLQKTHFYR